MPKRLSAPSTRPGRGGLQALAEDLSEEVRVGPLLDRILTHSTRLLDGAAGRQRVLLDLSSTSQRPPRGKESPCPSSR